MSAQAGGVPRHLRFDGRIYRSPREKGAAFHAAPSIYMNPDGLFSRTVGAPPPDGFPGLVLGPPAFPLLIYSSFRLLIGFGCPHGFRAKDGGGVAIRLDRKR